MLLSDLQVHRLPLTQAPIEAGAAFLPNEISGGYSCRITRRLTSVSGGGGQPAQKGLPP